MQNSVYIVYTKYFSEHLYSYDIKQIKKYLQKISDFLLHKTRSIEAAETELKTKKKKNKPFYHQKKVLYSEVTQYLLYAYSKHRHSYVAQQSVRVSYFFFMIINLVNVYYSYFEHPFLHCFHKIVKGIMLKPLV